MKIAIQGHPTRGKEVIQLLESLGGINKWDQSGRCTSCAYYIDTVGNIYSFGICGYCGDKKIYTLEEFEKEFPFKIGDKVIYDYTPNFVGIVVNIKFDDNIPYRVNINGTICTCGTNMLKLCKEMKEERNITLTLDKAKEWYKKGGDLKQIALQAFTETELNPLPRSWEEFCEKYPVKNGECWVGSQDIIHSATFPQDRKYKTWIPSRRSAEAHLAIIQLEQLRDCWRQGWEPDWNDDQQTKYCIVHSKEFKIHILYETRRFLSFPTIEMAKEFLECFKDLIEKAGDLI